MVDFARVFIRAGKGGDGAVSFRREKFIPKGGPDGGDGGRGGSIWVETDKEAGTLKEFAFRQKFLAENGGNGMGKKMYGKAGDDLVIKVPFGTVITLFDQNGEKVRVEDLNIESRILIAKGGKGGRGNTKFKSSTNTTPRTAEEGTLGDEFWMELELKLLADVALVGMPNVGKSTLLSVLTNAKPKIADYEFTTIEPNLGVMEHKGERAVIADIPGLIEGASEGKGLGERFLRHIERTKLLVHVLGIEVTDQDKDEEEIAGRLYEGYLTVRNEMRSYGRGVLKKKEIIVISRGDLVNEEKGKNIAQILKNNKIKAEVLSAFSREGLEKLKDKILKSL